MGMLLKPATPLTVILLAAFALLLLSVLSTPIVKAIPLAKVGGTSFGVLGYCTDSECTPFQVGYDFEGELKNANNFNLPENIRASLSSLLIVHPVAAFLVLVCLLLAAAAHLHSPSHSPRYLLGLLILLLPTLLVSMLAFLVDILLFVPHLQWGGWIVLGATILLTVAGVMTCAMRRTLVSRKARKRDIAENAEMSGENFYSRQNANAIKLDPVPTAPASSVQDGDSLPAFATFRSGTQSPDNDERPLTMQSPTPDTGLDNSTYYSPSESEPYGAAGALPSERTYGYGPPGDMYGRPPPASGGPVRGRGPGYGPPRGRGGHPMRGRGGYPGGPGGPRGPPHGYGGRGGPPRGGPPRGAMMMGPGGRPPPGFAPHNGPGPGGYGAYGNRRGHGPRGPPPGMRGPSPNGGAPGQDIEMETSPVNTHPGLAPSPGPAPVPSPTSLYSKDVYVPPRNNWASSEPTLPILDSIPPSRSPVSQPARSGSGQGYYEDIDPRFAQPSTDNMPSSLTPGGQHGEPEPKISFDDLPEGARSPTASETSSHFTSISQRGVNPRWRPPESENVISKRRQQERQDILLGGNPDFEVLVPRGHKGTGSSRRRPTFPTLPMIPATPTPPPLSPGGRYV